MFTKRSPDGSPPPRPTKGMETTPEGLPPPRSAKNIATTPDGSPQYAVSSPAYRPSSPAYQPRTPDYQPRSPAYRPATSPDGPPPRSPAYRPATSPDGPPPRSPAYRPATSPDGPPPPHPNVRYSPNEKNPKKAFDAMLQLYIDNTRVYQPDTSKNHEVEVRFGTNTKSARPISKIDYDNVVKHLFAAGFTTDDEDGQHILRIQTEYTDKRTGETKPSNIRTEVLGLDLVQEYCKSNSIQKILDMPSSISAVANKIKLTQKTFLDVEGQRVKPVDFDDFGFRLSYQLEQDFSPSSGIGKNTFSRWSDSKKTFRYINRVRFSHRIYPIFADISILRTSKKSNRIYVPQYTIQEAGVLTNPETYEIELEINKSMTGYGTRYTNGIALAEATRRCIRIVLSGLQRSNYPISYEERDMIQNDYLRMIYGDDLEKELEKRKAKRQYNRAPSLIVNNDFIAPSSYTLQIENVVEKTDATDSNIPNIREHYTVTDKADGERRMLYIAGNGRIYMIDNNMSIIFTGTHIADKAEKADKADGPGIKTLYNTLIDGEFIHNNKRGDPINLYAAFDIYFIGGKDVRSIGFAPELDTDLEKDFRLPILSRICRRLKPTSIVDGNSNEISCHFVIKCKTFYMTRPELSIFGACANILSNEKDGLFEYNTDGIIFTPSNTGVGTNRIGVPSPNFKKTWELSFKWKPPQFNTIDFLVSVKKDKRGNDETHNIFTEGLNMARLQKVDQYKTLVLRCGKDEAKHGYMNPMLDMINDKYPKHENLDKEDSYKPVPFQPTAPFDETACYCNVMLTDTGNSKLIMFTEEHEMFEEDMIVEFRYDFEKTGFWKWVPLRVRYDKTHELRNGINNYGNAYHVANSNWTSIHNPITDEMISTGKNIPEYAVNDDVYYNRSTSDSNTRGLRDFHNLFVKRKLIVGASRPHDTLIDFAVGKAGDMSKWIYANLGFVFGVDISKDNIQNRIDGACSRYISAHKKHNKMPGAMFVQGNSSLNIRSGEAFLGDKDREIARAIFGKGPKDREALGLGVYNAYGVGHEGFQVSSVQFALHYFFENQTTFHHFMTNIAECTKVGGYFIGTCYDGRAVFNKLENKNKGDSIVIMSEDGNTKIYEITKQYAQTGFPDDENSLGYSIDIFQETINKTFREYLVNYDYLVQILEDYGLIPVPREEARHMGLPNSSGSFRDLFDSLESELQRYPERRVDYGTALQMTAGEKTISFMNRYFIFKKVRNVNTEAIAKTMKYMPKHREAVKDESGQEKSGQDKEKTKVKIVKPRKLKIPKIIIDNYSPVQELSKEAVEKEVEEKEVEEVVVEGPKKFKIKKPVKKV